MEKDIRKKNGFTLIELIIVIAIIGILVLIATPKFIAYTQDAKLAQIKNDVKVVETVLDEYLIKNDSLPDTLQEFDYSTALAEDRVYGKTGLITNLEGTYVDVTDMDEVKAINSKLKGKFIANDKGEAYYVSDDKIIGKDDNSSGGVASEKVKDVFAFESYNSTNKTHTFSAIKIMQDGRVVEITVPNNLYDSETIDIQTFTQTEITELSDKNITNIITSESPTIINENMDAVYAISENGDVYVRGSNQYGELGLGHFDPALSFTKNDNLSNLKLNKIALGTNWAIGAKNETVYGWGNNDNYQAVPDIFDFDSYAFMNIPNQISSPFEHINTYSLDESIIQYNGKWYPSGINGFYFVSDDNVLYGVGYDILVDVLEYNINPGSEYNFPNPPTKIAGFNEEVKEIFSTGESVFVLTESGKLYGFGDNYSGQLGLGDTINRNTPTEITYFTNNNIQIQNLYTDNYSVFATTTDNELYSWGSNYYGQLGIGGTANKTTPTKITSFDGVPIKDIKAYYSTTFILTEAGELYGSGLNNYGQLGLSDTVNRDTPVKINFPNPNAKIKEIYTDGFSVFAITTDNKLYVWGKNDYGQLGLGSTTNQLTPTELIFFNGDIIKDIITDDDSTFVLKENGELYGFGRNTYGELGLGHSNMESSPKLINISGKLIDKIDLNESGSKMVVVETKDNEFYQLVTSLTNTFEPNIELTTLSPTTWGIVDESTPFIYATDSNNVMYSAKLYLRDYDVEESYFSKISPFVNTNNYAVKSVFASDTNSYITTYDRKVYSLKQDVTPPYVAPQSTQLYPMYYEEPLLAGLDVKDIKGDSEFILTEDGNLYYLFDEKLTHIGSNFDSISGNSYEIIAKRNNEFFIVYKDWKSDGFILEPLEFNIDVEIEKIAGTLEMGFILSTDGKLYFYINELIFTEDSENFSINQLRLTEIE